MHRQNTRADELEETLSRAGIRSRSSDLPVAFAKGQSSLPRLSRNVSFHVLSADLAGVPNKIYPSSEDSGSSKVRVRVSLGGGCELASTRAKHGRNPIWNERLDIQIPSAAQVFGVPAPTALVVELIIDDIAETVLASTHCR